MTMVRWSQRPARSFNNFMDDFFTVMPSIVKTDVPTVSRKHSIPVNIRETEKEYILEVFAPGLEKEDFRIDLENNLLTISADLKAADPATDVRQVRNEYQVRSFKRSFTLDETIDATQIVAKYINGVLTLNLPRKVEVKETAKKIHVE